MEKITFEKKLRDYIDAKVPIIYIESFDDNKIEKMVLNVVARRTVLEWNEMDGYFVRKRVEEGKEIIMHEEVREDYGLQDVLKTGVYEKELNRRVLIVKDVHSYLEDPKTVAMFKNACLKIEDGSLDTTFIFISEIVKVPRELEKYMTLLQEDFLDNDEIRQVIVEFLQSYSVGHLHEDLLEEIVIAFKGLSQLEIETILALAFSSKGEIDRETIDLIIEQKQQMIQKAGILEMVPIKESMEDIGGLENLKEWIQKKSKILKNMTKAEEYGVELPKGVLIAGVPGCGKSLNAKASAKLLEVPLLKLDMGRLMGKYVGESESNMRRAIALAEAISPCVLWVDELEKAFAGIGGDGGGAEVTTRLFGQFLTWMQEKKSAVFVVATANNIMKLPPELMRKGRFDEIFYVNLPSERERKTIFEIHIKKRRPNDLKNIDIDKLVGKTKGYSGADIEGIVKEGIESAFVKEKQSVTTEDILEAIEATHSLSEIMKEEIDKLEKEYKNRKFKNASKGE
ncbi:MAG: AAA family ATPase [Clostridiales bacterium]|nr:AAA family ATPase [Clostridiales bacterium]